MLKVRHLSQVFFAGTPRAMNRSGVSRRVLTLWSAVSLEISAIFHLLSRLLGSEAYNFLAEFSAFAARDVMGPL